MPRIWVKHKGGDNYRIYAQFDLPKDSCIFSSESLSGWGTPRGTRVSIWLSGEGAGGIKTAGNIKERGKLKWQKRSASGTDQKRVITKRMVDGERVRDTSWKSVPIKELFESRELQGKVLIMQDFQARKVVWYTEKKQKGKKIKEKHEYVPTRIAGTITYKVASLRPNESVESIEAGTKVTHPFDIPLPEKKQKGKK